MSPIPTTNDEFAAIDDEDRDAGEDVANLDLCHWDYFTRKYDREDFFVDGTANTNVPSVDPTHGNSTGGNDMDLPRPSTCHEVSLGSKHTSAGIPAPTFVDVNPNVVDGRAASGQTFVTEIPHQPPPIASDRINIKHGKVYATIYQLYPQHPANDDKSVPRCSRGTINYGSPASTNTNANAEMEELKLILDATCDSSSEPNRPSLEVPMTLLQLANSISAPPRKETATLAQQPLTPACHHLSTLDRNENNKDTCYHACENKEKQLEALLDAACDGPQLEQSPDMTALDCGDRPLLHSTTAATNVPTTLEALFSYTQHTKNHAICKPMATYNYFFRDERDNILRGITKPTDPLPSPVNDFSEKKKEALLHHRWNVEPTLGRRKHRKTHGKINFTMLTKEISSRWRNLPESGRAFYREVAKADKDRYDRIMGWKSS